MHLLHEVMEIGSSTSHQQWTQPSEDCVGLSSYGMLALLSRSNEYKKFWQPENNTLELETLKGSHSWKHHGKTHKRAGERGEAISACQCSVHSMLEGFTARGNNGNSKLLMNSWRRCYLGFVRSRRASGLHINGRHDENAGNTNAQL